MLSKKEIENKIYSFSKYMSNQTEDEIMQEYWKNIREYIEQLEKKVKELGKGQHTLMQSRRKWKYRYYKQRKKNN